MSLALVLLEHVVSAEFVLFQGSEIIKNTLCKYDS